MPAKRTLVKIVRSLGLVSLGTSMLLVPPAAYAQSELPSTDDYVITRSSAPLRPAPSIRYAPSGVTTAGQILRVVPVRDGDPVGWIRVRIPGSLGVLAPATHAAPTPDRTAVVLKAPTRLVAIDQRDPVNLSFKSVLSTPLDAGARLPLRQTLVGRDGLPAMYVVAPPPDATAYIPAARTDSITSAELETFLSGAAANLIPEINTSAETLATNEVGASENAPSQDANTESSEAPKSDLVTSIELLNRAYDRVRGGEDVELDEVRSLLASYREARARVENEPFNERFTAQLDERITFLSVRVRVRERLASLNDSDAQLDELDQKARDIARRIRDIDPAYTQIGRLTASPLYTGEDVRRLFILRSVEPGKRLLGYIEPTPEAEALLGRVVGVVATPGNVVGAARMLNVSRIGATDAQE